VFTKYRQFVENGFALCPRQALHASMLEIEHPATGERMRFESPVPQDMQALIGKWRAYSNGPMMTAEEED
jgi:23S rRNA pseudouridine1911/1915/1917 synthase